MQCVTWPVNVERIRTKRQEAARKLNWQLVLTRCGQSMIAASSQMAWWRVTAAHKADRPQTWVQGTQTDKQQQQQMKLSSQPGHSALLTTVRWPLQRLLASTVNLPKKTTRKKKKTRERPVAKKQLAVSWFSNIAQACVILRLYRTTKRESGSIVQIEKNGRQWRCRKAKLDSRCSKNVRILRIDRHCSQRSLKFH